MKIALGVALYLFVGLVFAILINVFFMENESPGFTSAVFLAWPIVIPAVITAGIIGIFILLFGDLISSICDWLRSII